jgi:hypothetical protein
MNARLCSTLFIAGCLTVTVLAQSAFDGRWSGEESSPRGTSTVVLQLVVNKPGATGAVTLGGNPSQPIVDGKVSGSLLTFRTATLLNGKEISITWQGSLKDDELSLIRIMGERKLPELVLRRAR